MNSIKYAGKVESAQYICDEYKLDLKGVEDVLKPRPGDFVKFIWPDGMELFVRVTECRIKES
jgi:hypothetical protein